MTHPIDEFGQRYIDQQKNIDPRERLLKKAEEKIKYARIWLLLVGVCTVALPLILYFWINHQENGIATLINCSIGLVFIGLAIWVNSKPKVATICGLGFYLLVMIFSAIADPDTLTKGLFIKVLVVASLVNGFRAARQAEALRKELQILDISDPEQVPMDQI